MGLVKPWIQRIKGKIQILLTTLTVISMNITPVYAISNNQNILYYQNHDKKAEMTMLEASIFKDTDATANLSDSTTNQEDVKSMDQSQPIGDTSLNTSIVGKPVHTTEEAQNVLNVILQLEGLQATNITFLGKDQSGNYLFSVWYKNFPHNVRIVTNDGYVIEDMD